MNWIDLFVEGLKATTPLEYIAVVFGLASVWFSKKEHIAVYPTGIVSVLIYTYLCFKAGLYAETGINVYYFVMSVYGWLLWAQVDDSKHHTLPISWNNRQENFISLALLGVSFAVLVWVLKTFTNSNVPYLDSFTTSIFFVGMWLMAKKKIENWLAWIIGDLICIPMYIYKGLVLTGVQYLIFTVLAIWGYLEWKKKFEQQPRNYQKIGETV